MHLIGRKYPARGGWGVKPELPNILPREGKLPILMDGKVVGGIGVSGGKSSEDAQVAKAGVDAFSK